MTKQEFKNRWESSENGGGLTLNDIADCSVAWGICSTPRTSKMDLVVYNVLVAAGVNDAEDYAPEED